MLHGIAKTIRFVTVPPIVVAAELTVLLLFEDVFPQTLDFWLALLCLGILPVFAYPLQRFVPAFRQGGQKMQRKLAFVLSPIGYIGAVICSILRGAVPNLLYISIVYLLSVILLILINALTSFHASGHGCSIGGSIILPCLFLGGYAILPGGLLFGLVFWASVYLKRHTPSEFLLGALCALVSAVSCYFLLHPVF